MGIAVTLRRGPAESPFRQLLLGLCRAPTQGDLLLCSGYIWEDPGQYSISADGLLAAIGQGIPSSAKITVVAGKLGDPLKWPRWEDKYRAFLRSLRRAGSHVDAYIAPNRNWHAKVAIRFDSSGLPVAGIVGSSNLTGPAYRENYKRWNYEADVLIWRPGAAFQPWLRDISMSIEDRFGKMLLNLAEDIEQPNEAEWLETLAQDVLREDGGLQSYEFLE